MIEVLVPGADVHWKKPVIPIDGMSGETHLVVFAVLCENAFSSVGLEVIPADIILGRLYYKGESLGDKGFLTFDQAGIPLGTTLVLRPAPNGK